MPESGVDPRHSAAFQRGYSGSEGGSRASAFSREYRAPTVPPPAARTSPRPASTEPSRWSLTADARQAGEQVDEVFAELDQPTISVVGDRDHLSERSTSRGFRLWNTALFAVGVGLIVLSFNLWLSNWEQMWGGFSTSSEDGVFYIDGPDGRQEIPRLQFQLQQYASSVAPWVGLVGLGTVVGTLFRVAPRR